MDRAGLAAALFSTAFGCAGTPRAELLSPEPPVVPPPSILIEPPAPDTVGSRDTRASLPLLTGATDPPEEPAAPLVEAAAGADAPARRSHGCCSPSDLMCMMRLASPPPKRALDRFATAEALARAAAAARSCKAAGGPTGESIVWLTLSSSGTVTGAELRAPYAGTPVGDCVSLAFRAARFPPFSGPSVPAVAKFAVD